MSTYYSSGAPVNPGAEAQREIRQKQLRAALEKLRDAIDEVIHLLPRKKS